MECEKGTIVAFDACPDCGSRRAWKTTKNRRTVMAICGGKMQAGPFSGLSCHRKDHRGGPASLTIIKAYAENGQQPVELDATTKQKGKDHDDDTGTGGGILDLIFN